MFVHTWKWLAVVAPFAGTALVAWVIGVSSNVSTPFVQRWLAAIPSAARRLIYTAIGKILDTRVREIHHPSDAVVSCIQRSSSAIIVTVIAATTVLSEIVQHAKSMWVGGALSALAGWLIGAAFENALRVYLDLLFPEQRLDYYAAQIAWINQRLPQRKKLPVVRESAI